MKKSSSIWKTTLGLAVLAITFSQVASATFVDYVIRNGAGGAPTIQSHPDGLEFIIDEANMKAALGSNDINNFTIGNIDSVAITRHDDVTRFTAGSGPAVAPYFNIWVTDGAGNYAVLANEPSNPAFQSLFTVNGDGSRTYDLSYGDLADKRVKVYETPGSGTNASWVHNMFGSDPLTFADVSSLKIAPPPASYITNAANGVGGGAPDELGTNVAYGFNWVFGDTLANYVSGEDGYVVSDYSASASAPIPEPGTMGLLLMGLGGMAIRARRKSVKS